MVTKVMVLLMVIVNPASVHLLYMDIVTVVIVAMVMRRIMSMTTKLMTMTTSFPNVNPER